MNRLLLILSATVLFFEISCKKSSSPNNTGGTTPINSGPQITAIHPTHGPGGSADTISGTGFNASISLDSFYINDVKTVVKASSDTQLIVTVPSLCGTGKVSLITNGQTVSGPIFTYDTVYAWSSIAQGFNNPRNIAADTAGNIYVANIGDGTIALISPGGAVSTFLSGFNYPWGLTIDQHNNIYIADDETANGATIYKYNTKGVGSQWATINGLFTSLTCDNAGNVYCVYDDNNSSATTSVAQISPSGNVSNLLTDGGQAINFGICLNPAGGFYLSGGNNGAQTYINTLSSSGVLGYVMLSGNTAGYAPSDILFNDGNLYVSSEPTNSIYKISPEGYAEPIITNIPLPWGLCMDKSGNMMVSSSISGSTAGQVSKITYK